LWIDVEEAKYWNQRILEETNRLLGVSTINSSAKATVEATPAASSEPAPPATPNRRVGWKKS
jgi:hypothetical protein